MASSPLSNYLRANRKRMGLSQEEVAFLLGCDAGTQVCRFERRVRTPNLEVALACEVIFDRPVKSLFEGLYQKIEEKVRERAEHLRVRVGRQKSGRRNTHKQRALEKVSRLRK